MTLSPLSSLGAESRKITDYKTVNTFLSSMSRGSIKSKSAYEYGLTHFQKFLSIEYPIHDIESILKPLSNINSGNGNGEEGLNLFSMLDEFVSYLVDSSLKLSSATIKLYMASVRSYLS
jgi:hypothetical protein